MNRKELVPILRNGGIAIIPTDTVYGIVCDALNEEAVKKVYSIKKRDFSKPMIILVADYEMLKKYTKSINDLEEELIDTYLPGKMTIILEKSDLIPSIVTAFREEIGIRIPDNENLKLLIKELNRPIIATSANISSNATITNINFLEENMKDNVDYIYDGGTIKGFASTIVKVLDDKIAIIRDGDLGLTIREKFKDKIVEK